MDKRYIINPANAKKVNDPCQVVVVGSGIAGLSIAIRLSAHTKVKIFTKSSLSESNTWYAQGGIAAAIKNPDSWKNHFRDTVEAGQGLCDQSAVSILVKNAPQMIEDLIENGITFDIVNGEISLTTEGGHSHPRVLHSGGDATGEEIEKKLIAYAKKIKNIEIFAQYFASDIITDADGCRALVVLNDKGDVEIFPAKNIVLSTGGIGQLYSLTTNPSISTGDGIAMAYRAGAAIKDIEFIQFHPTVFETKDKKLFLISEALRGEGAFLREASGKRFMVGKHPLSELAPRDIVVSEMVKVMRETKSDFVYIDATHLPEKMLKIRFPNILFKLKENGLDLAKDLVKVSPAAHYLNGGIRTDLDGLTDIKGLYACGETAATGAHGANRLASNSLIEGLVYSWQIYHHIAKDISEDEGIAGLSEKINLLLCEEKKHAGSHAAKVYPDKKVRQLIEKLRKTMSRKVGILRDEKGLDAAKDFIDSLLRDPQLHDCPKKDFLEFLNMLTTASLITKAAILRKESRGTHLRSDYPEKDDAYWKKHIILKKDAHYFEKVQ